ncbi:hypothetical protein BBJ28_00027080, partial [Nothophytophthora sp. Chile5]
MSTLTSTDMGELKRPTTRVHAPPGGGSSWSFGGDDVAPAPTGRKRMAPADVAMESPKQQPTAAPVAPPAASLTAPPSAPASLETVRVALLKTSSDAEIVDAMVQNCYEKLDAAAVSSETFTVATLEQLPYAANKLTQFGGFDAVICFGFLNALDPLVAALSAALTQSFISISVKNVRPVVRAVFV